MNYYATFLINWLSGGREYFDFLLQNRIFPEIGMEHGGLDFSKKKHGELARELADNGLGAAVHLPFFDVIPGSPDRNLRQKSIDKLMRAAEIAAIYQPDHLIGHPEFVAPYYASANNMKNLWLDNKPDEGWLSRSTEAWQRLLEATEAKLYLENTDDQTPEAILTLLTRLPQRAGVCFDIGHWYCAAGGRELKNLPAWLNPMAESGRLAHLHLHDNDGKADRHWALGEGGIDFGELFTFLKSHKLQPRFTLESHSLNTLKKSLHWLEEVSYAPAE